MILRPALCLDLDGTVRHSKHTVFISEPDDIELYPTIESRILGYKDNGYLIIAITNQGGAPHGFKTVEQVQAELDAMIELFKHGDPFDLVQICYFHPDGTEEPYNKRSLLRKPAYGMLAVAESQMLKKGVVIDWDNSLFVGDREEDEQVAANADIPFMWAREFREE